MPSGRSANLLNGAAQCIDFDAGEVVFRQSGELPGALLVVSGRFLRKTEWLQTRLTLAPARAGDLVELAAALGDGQHTYTLTAQTAGSVLLLPMEALNQAFQSYPPLRMRLAGGTGPRGLPRLLHLLPQPPTATAAGKLRRPETAQARRFFTYILPRAGAFPRPQRRLKGNPCLATPAQVRYTQFAQQRAHGYFSSPSPSGRLHKL